MLGKSLAYSLDELVTNKCASRDNCVHTRMCHTWQHTLIKDTGNFRPKQAKHCSRALRRSRTKITSSDSRPSQGGREKQSSNVHQESDVAPSCSHCRRHWMSFLDNLSLVYNSSKKRTSIFRYAKMCTERGFLTNHSKNASISQSRSRASGEEQKHRLTALQE